jgi:hypothetical protein
MRFQKLEGMTAYLDTTAEPVHRIGSLMMIDPGKWVIGDQMPLVAKPVIMVHAQSVNRYGSDQLGLRFPQR